MQLGRMPTLRQGSACRSAHAGRNARVLAAASPAAQITSNSASFKGDTNYKFAPLINGCWQLAGGHGREVYDNIMDKLQGHAEAGLTTFDTADIYGPSEEILGQFQRSWSASGRAPVQIFTKYVPNIFNGAPTPSAVEAAIKRSMVKLQVSQLDLVQMHWWEYAIPGMVDAAKALADLQAKGLIKHIGTTNMNTEALASIMDAGVPVVCNQVQMSLLDRRPLNGMLQYCQANGIKVLTYGSVGGGLLSDKYVEEPRTGLFGKTKYTPVDLNTSSLKMYFNIVKSFGGQDLWRELLATLKQVADKHKVSVADVSLRWVMQQGDGKTVHPIVGMRGTSHIEDNLRALSLQLDQQDLALIDAVLAKSTGPKGDCYSFERGT